MPTETIAKIVLAVFLAAGIAIGAGFMAGPLGAAVAAVGLLIAAAVIVWL